MSGRERVVINDIPRINRDALFLLKNLICPIPRTTSLIPSFLYEESPVVISQRTHEMYEKLLEHLKSQNPLKVKLPYRSEWQQVDQCSDLLSYLAEHLQAAWSLIHDLSVSNTIFAMGLNIHDHLFGHGILADLYHTTSTARGGGGIQISLDRPGEAAYINVIGQTVRTSHLYVYQAKKMM